MNRRTISIKSIFLVTTLCLQKNHKFFEVLHTGLKGTWFVGGSRILAEPMAVLPLLYAASVSCLFIQSQTGWMMLRSGLNGAHTIHSHSFFHTCLNLWQSTLNVIILRLFHSVNVTGFEYSIGGLEMQRWNMTWSPCCSVWQADHMPHFLSAAYVAGCVHSVHVVIFRRFPQCTWNTVQNVL